MKRAALELPGGQVSLEQAIELEGMLDLETEKRRYVPTLRSSRASWLTSRTLLRAFTDSRMDMVDKMDLPGETELVAPVKRTEST